MLTIVIVILIAGVLSAALYGRKRQWVSALLVLLATVALAAWEGGVTLPAQRAPDLLVLTDGATAPLIPAPANTAIDLRDGASASALLEAWSRAPAITVLGDGMSDVLLRDLPARSVRWQAPMPMSAGDLLWLDFPRELALGRPFNLTARRARATAGWRLQLLAENGQVIAENTAAGTSDSVSLQWLPPVAEVMLLQARLLDAAGKTVASGPLPLQVREATPLQVLSRFDAPSFDVRSLNRLLADSGALIDDQVTLGKALTRSETARTPLAAPNIIIADAAYVEHLGSGARAALLAQVGAGLPLLILAGNEADDALWAREFALHPRAPGKDANASHVFTNGASNAASNGAAALTLTAAPMPDDADKAWSVLARDSRRQPWLWQRDWQKGRIVWLGLADWHRYAIESPQALGLWWQGTLDLAASGSKDKLLWQPGDPLPQAGLRTEICARGAAPEASVQVDGMAPALWLARADQAEAACFALWPRQAGWLKLTSGAIDGRLYVYAQDAWPSWQRALRHDAMAAYAARLDVSAPPAMSWAPAWPFGVVFGVCMLLLWWRERR